MIYGDGDGTLNEISFKGTLHCIVTALRNEIIIY